MKIELERRSLCVAYILPNLRDCASSVSGEKPKAVLRLPSSPTDLEHHYTDPGSVRNKIRLRRLFREFAELMCRFQQVLAQISPGLRDVLGQYNLVWE